MLGVELREKRDEVLKELQRAKILAIPAGENVVRFLPAYILKKNHVDEALEKLGNILLALSPV